MFRKSGQDDKIHHTNIKRGITSHFSRMLKILQQKHVQHSEGDEYVYSNDESNNLCNALEAVFLHGLKAPVTTKLSSYVGYVGLATPQDTAGVLNFWAVAEKFTHKNVITHLKSLRQITTEIGLCRAWIRLALNDGLMESYLHSVVVDAKSVKYFYHSYSYLRDHEQPGILSNYLTGLMSLTFQLSLNSSVLNSWNNSTLQLISNLGSAPPPVVRSPPPAAQVFSPPKVGHREFREGKQAGSEDSEPIVARRKSSSTSSQEKAKEHALFNSIRDVEAIRRLNRDSHCGGRSYTPSECSSSSHTSCPDPSGNLFHVSPQPELAKSPHLYPRPGDRPGDTSQNQVGPDNAEGGKDEPLLMATTSPIATANDPEEEEDLVKHLMMSPPRERSRRVSEEDSLLISPLGSVSSPPSFASPTDRWSKSDSQGAQAQSEMVKQNFSPSPTKSPTKSRTNHPEKDLSDTHLSWTYPNQQGLGSSLPVVPREEEEDLSEPCDDIYGAAEDSPSPTPEFRPSPEKTVNTVLAGLPPMSPVKLDPSEQDAILKKVLSEIDLQADREREARDLADSQKARNGSDLSEKQGYFSPGPGTSPCATNLVVKETKEQTTLPSEIEEVLKDDHFGVTPKDLSFEKSSDTIIGNDVSEGGATRPDQVSNGPSGVGHIDISQGRSVEGEGDEEECGSGRFGNSLGSMMGWSSEIDSTQRAQNVHDKEDNARTESFAAMLRSYIPGTSAPGPAVTLDQVIEDLPVEDGVDEEVDETNGTDQSHRSQTRSLSGSSKASQAELKHRRQDSCLVDFEVVESPADSLCGQVEVNSSRMIYLFRVPQEHGLSHQNFTCRGCSRPIGIIYGQPRVCSFDGGLYCYECHENTETYIPSSIVFDWDFRKKKVCNENYKFLTELEGQALYDIQQLNPKLYSHVPELQDLKILRQRLCYLKSYLFTCSEKIAESLRQKVWPREHLYDRRDLYSVSDLLQVQAGTLQRLVKDLVRFSSQHVYSCALCSQKGYVCEICRNSRIIYAFEVDTTVRCERCKAVYHKTCMTQSLPCPKCERWGRRSNSSIIQSHPEDYGSSPTEHAKRPQLSSPSGSLGRH